MNGIEVPHPDFFCKIIEELQRQGKPIPPLYDIYRKKIGIRN